MYRLETVSCAVEKEYEYNMRYRILVGKEFLSNTGLAFPTRFLKKDSSYKTVFGYTFWHPGVIYSRNDVNICKASERLLGKIEPQRVGLHEKLERNQRRNVRLLPRLSRIIVKINNKYKDAQLDAASLYTEIEHYVNTAKLKKKLKQQAFKELNENGELYHRLYTKLAEGKVKSEEWAKWLKYPRLFLNLGFKSCLVAGFLMHRLKNALTNQTDESEFVGSPDKDTLSRVFDRLINVLTIYFPFFSDDSCIGIRCIDGVFWANVDITRCDGTHTEVIFNLLKLMVKNSIFEEPVNLAIRQCLLPLSISSYGVFHKHTVLLKPLIPVLYSGSVLTTMINNIANILIFLSIRDLVMDGDKVRAGLTRSQCEFLVRVGAEEVGYLVTVDVCSKPEHIQFLKHSPAYGPSGWQPLLNPGVILRLFGSCYGDLPGRKDEAMEDRAYNWNHQIVKSLVHAGDYQLTRVLRERFGPPPNVSKRTQAQATRRIEKAELYKVRASEARTVYDASVMARYDLTAAHLDELCSLLTGDFYGVSIECLASRRILAKDYGL